MVPAKRTAVTVTHDGAAICLSLTHADEHFILTGSTRELMMLLNQARAQVALVHRTHEPPED